MTAAGRAGMARGSVQPGTVAAAAAAAVSDLAEWSGLLPLEHRAAPALTHPAIISAVGVYHAGPVVIGRPAIDSFRSFGGYTFWDGIDG
jgi:hypothetical protein